MNLSFFKKRFNKSTFFALSSVFLLTTVLLGANLLAAFAIAFALSTLCIMSFHLIKDPDSIHLFYAEEASDESAPPSILSNKKIAITPKRDLDDLERRKAITKAAWDKTMARREADLARRPKTTKP